MKCLFLSSCCSLSIFWFNLYAKCQLQGYLSQIFLVFSCMCMPFWPYKIAPELNFSYVWSTCIWRKWLQIYWSKITKVNLRQWWQLQWPIFYSYWMPKTANICHAHKLERKESITLRKLARKLCNFISINVFQYCFNLTNFILFKFCQGCLGY